MLPNLRKAQGLAFYEEAGVGPRARRAPIQEAFDPPIRRYANFRHHAKGTSSWCAVPMTSSPALNTRPMPSGFKQNCGIGWRSVR